MEITLILIDLSIIAYKLGATVVLLATPLAQAKIKCTQDHGTSGALVYT
jgi:hypothetical protein